VQDHAAEFQSFVIIGEAKLEERVVLPYAQHSSDGSLIAVVGFRVMYREGLPSGVTPLANDQWHHEIIMHHESYLFSGKFNPGMEISFIFVPWREGVHHIEPPSPLQHELLGRDELNVILRSQVPPYGPSLDGEWMIISELSFHDDLLLP
jgi:hypothetical protein